ncbi:unnamed protein product [Echinostoma caproni]|uniref:RING-type domain-containing protein n=1 Tax=Echinostoma caproni TaxID=27848 RepID=A0A183ALT4_9TREM|nr:unnamed protein product [Echinostoma caproni]
MLVLFGNLQSPVGHSASDDSPPARRQRFPNGADVGEGELGQEDLSYHGQPAGDIWILTRTKANPQSLDWSSVNWFWTKVDCTHSSVGCPPLDFYHACTVCLPWASTATTSAQTEATASQVDEVQYAEQQLWVKTPPSIDLGRTFIVVCISQPTRSLLEEAAKQRRYWWHRARATPDTRVKSVPRSNSLSSSIMDITPDIGNAGGGSCDSVTMSVLPQSSPSSTQLHPGTFDENQTNEAAVNRTTVSLPPSPQGSSYLIQSSRRSAQRRARQLEALAVQERRLFGSRLSPSQTISGSQSHSTSPNLVPSSPSNQPSSLYSLLQSGTQRPLAAYTFSIHVPPETMTSFGPIERNKSVTDNKQSIVGEWLIPKRSHFLDLVFGPSECLGFSCTFGHGCVFLFGGLCDSDEASHDQTNAPSGSVDSRPIDEPFHRSEPLRTGDLGSLRLSAARTSQFYVLQAQSLSTQSSNSVRPGQNCSQAENSYWPNPDDAGLLFCNDQIHPFSSVFGTNPLHLHCSRDKKERVSPVNLLASQVSAKFNTSSARSPALLGLVVYHVMEEWTCLSPVEQAKLIKYNPLDSGVNLLSRAQPVYSIHNVRQLKRGQCTENRRTHSPIPMASKNSNQLPAQVSDSVSNDDCKEPLMHIQEGRVSSPSIVSRQLLSLPIEPGTRPSMVSVCGVEMDVDELRSLEDVPPEFTTAEALLRRAVKSDSIHAERLSLFARHSTSHGVSKQGSSLEDLSKRIPTERKIEEVNVEFRIPLGKMSSEVDHNQPVSPNRTARSSILTVHPPHPHPTHVARLSEELASGTEFPELNSKITAASWATMDSTELKEPEPPNSLDTGRDSENPYLPPPQEPRTWPKRTSSVDYSTLAASVNRPPAHRASELGRPSGECSVAVTESIPGMKCYGYSMHERQIQYEEHYNKEMDLVKRIQTTKERTCSSFYWTRRASMGFPPDHLHTKSTRPPSVPRKEYHPGRSMISETREQFTDPTRRQATEQLDPHLTAQKSPFMSSHQPPESKLDSLSGDRNLLPQMESRCSLSQCRATNRPCSGLGKLCFYPNRPDSEPGGWMMQGSPCRPARSQSVPNRHSTSDMVTQDPFATTYIYHPRSSLSDQQGRGSNGPFPGDYEEFHPFQSNVSLHGPVMRTSDHNIQRCIGPACGYRPAAGKPCAPPVPTSLGQRRSLLDEIHIGRANLPERYGSLTSQRKPPSEMDPRVMPYPTPRESRDPSPVKPPPTKPSSSTPKMPPKRSPRKGTETPKIPSKISPQTVEKGERELVSNAIPRKSEQLFGLVTSSGLEAELSSQGGVQMFAEKKNSEPINELPVYEKLHKSDGILMGTENKSEFPYLKQSTSKQKEDEFIRTRSDAPSFASIPSTVEPRQSEVDGFSQNIAVSHACSAQDVNEINKILREKLPDSGIGAPLEKFSDGSQLHLKLSDVDHSTGQNDKVTEDQQEALPDRYTSPHEENEVPRSHPSPRILDYENMTHSSQEVLQSTEKNPQPPTLIMSVRQTDEADVVPRDPLGHPSPDVEEMTISAEPSASASGEKKQQESKMSDLIPTAHSAVGGELKPNAEADQVLEADRSADSAKEDIEGLPPIPPRKGEDNYPGVPSANMYRTLGSTGNSPAGSRSSLNERRISSKQRKTLEEPINVWDVDSTLRAITTTEHEPPISQISSTMLHTAQPGTRDTISDRGMDLSTAAQTNITENTQLSEKESDPSTPTMYKKIKTHSLSPVQNPVKSELAENSRNISVEENAIQSLKEMEETPIQDVPAVSVTEHMSEKSPTPQKLPPEVSPSTPILVPVVEKGTFPDAVTSDGRPSKQPESMICLCRVDDPDRTCLAFAKICPSLAQSNQIPIADLSSAPISTDQTESETVEEQSKLVHPSSVNKLNQPLTLEEHRELSSARELSAVESMNRRNISDGYALYDFRKQQFLGVVPPQPLSSPSSDVLFDRSGLSFEHKSSGPSTVTSEESDGLILGNQDPRIDSPITGERFGSQKPGTTSITDRTKEVNSPDQENRHPPPQTFESNKSSKNQERDLSSPVRSQTRSRPESSHSLDKQLCAPLCRPRSVESNDSHASNFNQPDTEFSKYSILEPINTKRNSESINTRPTGCSLREQPVAKQTDLGHENILPSQEIIASLVSDQLSSETRDPTCETIRGIEKSAPQTVELPASVTHQTGSPSVSVVGNIVISGHTSNAPYPVTYDPERSEVQSAILAQTVTQTDPGNTRQSLHTTSLPIIDFREPLESQSNPISGPKIQISSESERLKQPIETQTSIDMHPNPGESENVKQLQETLKWPDLSKESDTLEIPLHAAMDIQQPVVSKEAIQIKEVSEETSPDVVPQKEQSDSGFITASNKLEPNIVSPNYILTADGIQQPNQELCGELITREPSSPVLPTESANDNSALRAITTDGLGSEKEVCSNPLSTTTVDHSKISAQIVSLDPTIAHLPCPTQPSKLLPSEESESLVPILTLYTPDFQRPDSQISAGIGKQQTHPIQLQPNGESQADLGGTNAKRLTKSHGLNFEIYHDLVLSTTTSGCVCGTELKPLDQNAFLPNSPACKVDVDTEIAYDDHGGSKSLTNSETKIFINHSLQRLPNPAHCDQESMSQNDTNSPASIKKYTLDGIQLSEDNFPDAQISIVPAEHATQVEDLSNSCSPNFPRHALKNYESNNNGHTSSIHDILITEKDYYLGQQCDQPVNKSFPAAQFSPMNPHDGDHFPNHHSDMHCEKKHRISVNASDVNEVHWDPLIRERKRIDRCRSTPPCYNRSTLFERPQTGTGCPRFRGSLLEHLDGFVRSKSNRFRHFEPMTHWDRLMRKKELFLHRSLLQTGFVSDGTNNKEITGKKIQKGKQNLECRYRRKIERQCHKKRTWLLPNYKYILHKLYAGFEPKYAHNTLQSDPEEMTRHMGRFYLQNSNLLRSSTDILTPQSACLSSNNLHFDKNAVFVRGENANESVPPVCVNYELKYSAEMKESDGLTGPESGRSVCVVTPRHVHYMPTRHGTVKEMVYNSNKITPEAQEILLIIRDTITMIMQDLAALDRQLLDRNFRACEAISEHLVLLPNMLITLLDHLHYSPAEYELVHLTSSINNLIAKIASDPVTILFHLIELGYRLNELARIFGEDLVPDNMPQVVHAIQSKLHVSKIISDFNLVIVFLFSCCKYLPVRIFVI